MRFAAPDRSSESSRVAAKSRSLPVPAHSPPYLTSLGPWRFPPCLTLCSPVRLAGAQVGSQNGIFVLLLDEFRLLSPVDRSNQLVEVSGLVLKAISKQYPGEEISRFNLRTNS